MKKKMVSDWNYVVTAQKPTCVTHSCVGNFTSPTELNLIVAKCSRIGIYLLTPQRLLRTLLDVPLYGRVAVLELFRPPGATQDFLFIATEGYKYCVLGWDSNSSELITREMGDVSDRMGRPTDTGQIGVIDPECRLIGLHLYQGLFKVLDIKFLYGCAKPTIAVLYQDNEDARHVNTYEVSLEDKDISDGPWSLKDLDNGADLLIPVPSTVCGVLIIGEQTIVYCSSHAYRTIPIEPSITKAYGRVDVDGSRYLLGGHAGQMHLLVLTLEKEKVAGLKLELLGETSIASTISFLPNDVVFVGSSYGDSQLIKINLQPDAESSIVGVLEKYVNLGPIVDFCVVEHDRRGQSSVITCSGAYKNGSLCIFRNGIRIKEQASIALGGITGMWSLKSSIDTFLVVSYIDQTSIFTMNIEGDALEEQEFEGSGFLSQVRTLFCHDAVCNQFVQVTSDSVRLVSSNTQELRDEWDPPVGLTVNVATANASQVLLATGDQHLFYLEIGDGTLQEVKRVQLAHDVSCLDISPISDDPKKSQLAAVGTWIDKSVSIFVLPDLTLKTKEEQIGDEIARSVLLCAFEGISYLLCALGNGDLLTFQLDMSCGELRDRKKVSLGTWSGSLRTFSLESGTHVFSPSGCPLVIHSNNKNLVYSNVDLKEASLMCPFNSAALSDSLVIASEGNLIIGTTDGTQNHILRSIPIGEHARCICHQEQTRTFAICSLKNEPRTGDSEKHNVHLLDDQIMWDEQTCDILSTFPLEPSEHGCSILSCSFTDDNNVYYCVGTALVSPEENEPTKGRILVLVAKEKRLELIAEGETNGAVYSLSGFNGKLVASVNQKIELYKWMLRDDGTRKLQLECGHHGHIVALNMQTRGDFIVVGDLMNSISVLIYKEGAIEEIARDDNACWMSAVEILDDETYLGADSCFNLFKVKKKNGEGATDGERSHIGEYHIGDCVNRFRHGSVGRRLPRSEIGQIPTIIFGTVNGLIGVIASLPQDQYEFLEKLQTNLTKVIKGVGGLSHKQWRSFKNEKRTAAEARSFLDGDLIESFLDLSESKREEIARGMVIEVKELYDRVEELTRLH